MEKNIKNERVLGIDPGYGRIGWGMVEKQNGNWVHVAHGCIETGAKDPFIDRLSELYRELEKIIKKYNPSCAGVEELFFFKNVKTAMKVGQARGVILLTLFQAGLEIYEFTPLQVKQALTGYGRAEKGQIQKMVSISLNLSCKGLQDDAADALAVAITCGASLRLLSMR
ncbi:crossover junction endodeoxyribonuclease RuvC [Patescibacteria group bacterium]|nr:crossover junction endodeoxyribonuclease RuvC [Patescibacteria group bacterium]MBU1895629.1 crossover junction endodeoxyribonuclease RuvC [Patescibacteria group bacterium]